MRNILRIATVALLTIGLSPNILAQSVFELKDKVCKMGTVKAGETGTCTVTFINTGKGKANMGAIRPSSDAISSDWSSKVLLPGESDSFTISVNTEGLSGEFKKSVLLIFDRTRDPLTVWVTGSIE